MPRRAQKPADIPLNQRFKQTLESENNTKRENQFLFNDEILEQVNILFRCILHVYLLTNILKHFRKRVWHTFW